jgi:dTDP-4-dehydrorhamnose 3,5-epimerase
VIVDEQKVYVTRSSIPGLILVERPTLADERGFFREVERRASDVNAVLGSPVPHVQWNHARSVRGVLRGIHIARWTKCIYVVRGEVQAVIVDLRPESSTFGRHESLRLGESRRAMAVVPPGCGNSYLVLSDVADYIYSVDQEWTPGGEIGVAWDDPDLAIHWQLDGPPILSERDRQLPRVREVFPDRLPPSGGT